jgi:hypothetical protein
VEFKDTICTTEHVRLIVTVQWVAFLFRVSKVRGSIIHPSASYLNYATLRLSLQSLYTLWYIIVETALSLQVGGGLEYLHRSPASCKKRVVRDDVKGTQCPGL